MTSALDSLKGRCLECGSGPVVIDTAGDGVPIFWAYCHECNHTCCTGVNPEEVVKMWDALQYQVHGSILHRVQTRIDADTVLSRSTENDITFDLKVTCSAQVYEKLINLLGAIEHNTGVGHSCKIAAFFDGDGADKVIFEGLPDNLGGDMASACSSHGDGLMTCIDSRTATAYNESFRNGETMTYTKTEAYPEKDHD